jgi:hypothetical protein
MWFEIRRVLGINSPCSTLVYISDLWSNKKKNMLSNMINAANLRIIWLVRNDIVLNRTVWVGM